MRLGYGTYVTSPQLLDAEVDAVADAGFDAVLFSEHHGMRGYVPDPLAAATYVLGRRPELRSGPVPMVLPLHDPVHVAEAAALADALSGGRLMFGVAAGFLARDFEQRGLDVADRAGLLEEATVIVRRIWAGELDPFAGEYFSVPALEPLAQPPAQSGGPPVWMASGTPGGIRRAARIADGIVIDSVRASSNVVDLAESFRHARLEAGMAPGTVAVMRRGWIGPEDEVGDFVANLQRELSGFATRSAGQSMPWLDEPGRVVSVAEVRDRVVAGTPEDVSDQLRSLAAEAGVDYVIVKVQWTSGIDPDVLREQIRRWAPVCAEFQVN